MDVLLYLLLTEWNYFYRDSLEREQRPAAATCTSASRPFLSFCPFKWYVKKPRCARYSYFLQARHDELFY